MVAFNGFICLQYTKEEQIGILSLFLSYFLFLINLVRGSSCISCHFRKDMDHCVLLVSRHGPELASVEVPQLGCCFRSSLFSPCGNGSYPRASPGGLLYGDTLTGSFLGDRLGGLLGYGRLTGLHGLALLLGRLLTYRICPRIKMAAVLRFMLFTIVLNRL